MTQHKSPHHENVEEEVQRSSALGAQVDRWLGDSSTPYSQAQDIALIRQELAALGLDDDEYSADALEEEELWTSLQLLRHTQAPPTLDPASFSSIEDAVLDAFSEHTAQQPRQTLLEHMLSWFRPKAPWVLAGAMACVLVLVGVTQYRVSQQRSETLSLKSTYQSPWRGTQNPFHATRSSAERVGKVVDSMLRERRGRWVHHYTTKRTQGQRF
ncbi:MAG TPA: hypothetical protein DCE42_09555 [Myxococcales bacterium]|nr:hypothetical protein [Deltaproteobacteria bacterium]MBU51629.1 hypothetical protein [Deltaproteobacteria bacterium]HAA54992.1 hypothetical protein [Myxococcales bacterium]